MIKMEGKPVVESVIQDIKKEIQSFTDYPHPHLAAILVGNNGASETYVSSKIKRCKEAGIRSSLLRFTNECSEEELMNCIAKLNADEDVDGILVQMPLPGHINEQRIVNLIAPEKDVDGFHPENAGKLMLGLEGLTPATPTGILMMLSYYGIETSGKHAVVIGRSNIVGRPISVLLSSNKNPGNCTVTLCHSKTENLEAFTQSADIIITALGNPEFLKASMVKTGAIVIDVGITRVADPDKLNGFAIKGDVDYNDVASKCSYITPVPGGVGLMTIAALLKNTLLAWKHRRIKK